MKKFFRTILIPISFIAVFILLCMVAMLQWKEQDKKWILFLLKEKYGEEFVIHNIEIETIGGGGNGVPDPLPPFNYLFSEFKRYEVICSPKANKDILFEASVNGYRTKITYDNYPQAVIEEKTKNIAEEIASKYTDDFIIYTYVSAPSKTVSTDDSTWEKVTNAKPYESAEEITIENYVDKYFETSDLSMDIILLNDMVENTKQRNEMLEKLSLKLKGLSSLVDIYYTDSKTMQECKKYIDNNKYDTRLILDTAINDKGFCYVYYQRQETDYKWVFNESSSVISYE